MDWFGEISDFIYSSFQELGPFVYAPILLLWLCLSGLAVALSSPVMKALKIPSKYQDYVHAALFLAVFSALAIIIGISLAKHPDLDWMQEFP